MGTTPDELRAEIEQTRANLAYDTNMLAEKVRPSSVMHRRTAAVKGGLSTMRERVMGPVAGAASTGGSRMGETMSGVGSSVTDKAAEMGASISDTARSAPEEMRRRTEGNPLAAGLIAFGAGLLASSLLPSTSVEQRAATGLREQAEPVIDKVKEEAKGEASQLKDELAPKAQHAAQELKAAATDAVQQTTEEARQAAGEVREHAQSTAQEAREQRQGGSSDPYGSGGTTYGGPSY